MTAVSTTSAPGPQPDQGKQGGAPQPATSTAFHLLHPHVRYWIYNAGWTGLRAAQENTIPLLITPRDDVLISAATAGGKTEAAFLPIVSNLLCNPPAGAGLQVLYLAPLKALINDQYDRLTDLCEGTEVAVHRWHGDVSAGRKTKLRKHPSGILLTTPESLEAMFVLRGRQTARLFGQLRYVVVDELHAFLGTERGAQLRSLLHRLDLATRTRPARVGLSATLGDMGLAAAQLRPANPAGVQLVRDTDGGQQLLLAVRGYLHTATPTAEVRPRDATTGLESPPASRARTRSAQAGGNASPAAPGLVGTGQDARGRDDKEPTDDKGDPVTLISAYLFGALRGSDNLVFANSRGRVEQYADRLRHLSESARQPNEFFPHHGSLSKELREEVEAALKDRTRPTTAVATTTLEMGIDIGSVRSIAQIDPPSSVAALRQRLGRSGRRGEPARLQAHITEPEVTAHSPLADQLRGSLVQTTAIIELLLQGWCEPPEPAVLHTSTLVQQLLSLIAQLGGVTPAHAHAVLCPAEGPFSGTSPERFKALLRSLHRHEVIDQSADGTLLLAHVGERTVNHHTFYAAFTTPQEYRLLTGGRLLGAMPVEYPLYVGLLLIFGGKRWRVVAVEHGQRTIDLVPTAGGSPPHFGGDSAPVHDHVRARMRSLLAGSKVPVYLDAPARQLFLEGRATFHRHQLAERSLLARGAGTVLVPWVGTRTGHTLAMLLRSAGVESDYDGLTISCDKTTAKQLLEVLDRLAADGPFEPLLLTRIVKDKAANKYDRWLDEPLLDEDYAVRALDVATAHKTVLRLLQEASQTASTREVASPGRV